MSDKKSKKANRKNSLLVEIPLHFHSFDNAEQRSPAAFNDTQYKVRLIRYTAHLRHLLDNPPVFKPICCDDNFHHEQVDNYLWVVGELIGGIYEINHIRNK